MQRYRAVFLILPFLPLILPPEQLVWHAAQGVICKFDQSHAQCRKNAWGFDLTVVGPEQLADYPALRALEQRLAKLRSDQLLLVLRVRWINRSDQDLLLDPSNIWLWIQNDRPYSPMTWEELVGLWNDLDLGESETGRWFQQNLALHALLVPAKHYSDKMIAFRLPALGWTRLQMEIDPIWLGTELQRFRIWAERVKPRARLSKPLPELARDRLSRP